MQYIEGNDRDQMFMLSLEEAVDINAFVRVVDAFGDAIDYKSFDFGNTECKEEGRPAYHPSALMKLYLYGYRYGIRTTRKLEREARTNMEAMWLLKGLKPHYKTIANFRKDNTEAFRAVFRRFVLLLKEMELIEGDTVAIDSFKIRASNSLKNNFNEAKLKRHLEYIDEQIAEYEAELDLCEEQDEKQQLEAKLSERKEKQEQYQEIKKKLDESGEQQISLTDPDSRSVVLHRKIVNVGYNIQSVCDEKNKLLVDYDTGTVNDTHSLAPMSIQAKELLGVEKLTVLADKGYHTGKQLRECNQNGITTYVSPRDPGTPADSGIPLELFYYSKNSDTYTCPEGHMMTTNGTWYKHSNSRKGRDDAHRFKRYLTPACKNCRLKSACTKNSNGRFIDRSEYADIVEANNKRVTENPEYYRQRQQITEHQFGTIKRQMGYTHTNIRGKPKVMGEIGLMFTVYNLVRCVRILGMDNFVKALKQRLCAKISLKYDQIWVVLRKLLFLLQKKTTGMSACIKSCIEVRSLYNGLGLEMEGGCCTDSRYTLFPIFLQENNFFG
jgi:transposase